MPTQQELAAKEREEQERQEREEQESDRLPDDAVVDVEAEKKEANSDEILVRLDQELVGLAPVKTRIRVSARSSASSRPGPPCTCHSPAARARARPPYRDAPPDHGEQPRRPGGHPRRLQGQDGPLKMDHFLGSNPGMGSRIAHHIHFPDYTLDELMGIACLILDEQRSSFSGGR